MSGSHLLLLQAFEHEYCDQPVARVRRDHLASNSFIGHALLAGAGGLLIWAGVLWESVGARYREEGGVLYLMAFVATIAFVVNGGSALVDYRFSAKTVLDAVGRSVGFLWRSGGRFACSGASLLTKGFSALKELLSERKSATKRVAGPMERKGEGLEVVAALGGFLYCPYVPLNAKRNIVEVMHQLQAGSQQEERTSFEGAEIVRKVNNLLEQVRVAESLYVLRSKNQGEGLSGTRDLELLLEPVWTDLHELLASIP